MISNNHKNSPQRGEAGADSKNSETMKREFSVSQNNFNTNHTPEPNNKTILTEVGGFTPVIDSIRDQLGIVSAVIFGVIWRYCQMEDGKCTASQSKIAERSGYSLRTIITHTKKLVKAGYLRSEISPGVGVTYYDTGKAGIKMGVSAFNNPVNTQDTKANPGSKCTANKEPTQQMHTYLRNKCVQPTQQMHTKKVFKKDLKDTSSDEYTNTNQQNNNDDDTLINLINNICREILGYRLEVTPDTNELLQTITGNDITEPDIKQGIIDYKTHGDNRLRGMGSLTSWIVNAHRKRINALKPRTRTYTYPNGSTKEVVIGNGYPYKPRTRVYTYPDGSTEEVVIG